jgi:cytochrome c-type biogenesis protein CcmH/NrfG
MNARPHLHAGATLLKAQDFDRAQAAFKSALSINPKNADANVGLARALQLKGDVDQAARYLREALRLDPQHVRARLLMARMLAKANNTDGAAAELESLAKLQPGKGTASFALARLHVRKKDYARASKVLDSATKQSGEDPRVWKALALLRARSEDYSGAEEAFSKAIDLKPRNVAAYFRLVDVMLAQGKYGEALQALGKVARRKDDATVQRYYGEIYRQQGMFKEAVDSYRAALLHTPDGEATVSAIEKDAGKEIPGNWEAVAKRYLPAMENLAASTKEARRKKRSERSRPSRAKRRAAGGNRAQKQG